MKIAPTLAALAAATTLRFRPDRRLPRSPVPSSRFPISATCTTRPSIPSTSRSTASCCTLSKIAASRCRRRRRRSRCAQVLGDIKSVQIRTFKFDVDGAYNQGRYRRGAPPAVRAGLESRWCRLTSASRARTSTCSSRPKAARCRVSRSSRASRVEFTIVNVIGTIDIDKLAKTRRTIRHPESEPERVTMRIIAMRLNAAREMPDTLLPRARAGDTEAFATLVRQHQASVFSIGLRMLNRRDAAEDLAQDVFLQLFRKLETIESPEHLGFWLRRVAANLAIDRLRSPAHALTQPLDDDAEVAAHETGRRSAARPGAARVVRRTSPRSARRDAAALPGRLRRRRNRDGARYAREHREESHQEIAHDAAPPTGRRADRGLRGNHEREL